MVSRIVVGLDGSERSERSLPWVRVVFPSAEVILVRVIETIAPMTPQGPILGPDVIGDGEKYLKRLAAGLGAPTRTLLCMGSAAAALLDAAQEHGADLLAVTTHGGKAVERALFGGTTEKLLHAAETPLFVVPSWTKAPAADRIRNIVVPLDGSEVSERILPLAAQVAESHSANMLLVHVLGDKEDDLRAREMDFRLHGLAERLHPRPVNLKVAIRRGAVPDEILRVIDLERAELVVMSGHGYGAIKRMLFGSVASKLVRLSSVPVLAARSSC